MFMPSKHFMICIFFLIFFSCQTKKVETVFIQQYIAGNWSSRSNNQLRTLYFIPISSIQHYQALLNDKFLDIYVKSLLSVQVVYDKYNFSLNFRKVKSHLSAVAQIEPHFFIDVFTYSRDVIDIVFTNLTKVDMMTWTFQRPIPQLTTKDKLVVTIFFSCIFVLIIYSIFFRYCRKQN